MKTRTNKRLTAIVALGLASFWPALGLAHGVIYVDDRAAGPVHDGSSWHDPGANQLRHPDSSGSGTDGVLDLPLGIALELPEGKMYWTDRGYRAAGSGPPRIQRANLDGSEVEDLITSGLSVPIGIALDTSGGKMYWVDWGTNNIQRANLDGSEVEDLVDTGFASHPKGIALDLAAGKMYWNDRSRNIIQRADLDGSNIETLIDVRASFIALDLDEGKIYWTHLVENRISRADLDGSNTEHVVTTFGWPSGIALDVAADKMYWTIPNFGRIQRANLDGSEVEDLITSGLSLPTDIALDPGAGRMYWVEGQSFRARIRRANLDGSDIEDLVTGLSTPLTIECLPLGGTTVTCGQIVEVECHVFVTEAVTARSSSLDLPCVLPAVTGTTGALTSVGISVDTAHTDPYYLFNVFGLGGAETDQTSCRADGFIPGILELPLFRPAGSEWYLATIEYLVSDCATPGDYEILPENLSYPPDEDDQTTVIDSDYVQIPLLFTPTIVTVVDDGSCTDQPIPYGDVFPDGGNGVVDIDDVLCLLAGFADASACPGADIFPCGGNSVIDIDDIVAVLLAFAGISSCPAPCPP